MNKKWIRITLPNELKLKEARDWCEKNCHYKFRIRQPKADRTGFLYKKPFVIFQNETDAMAFKLRWLE